MELAKGKIEDINVVLDSVQFTLIIHDTGSGTISMADFQKRQYFLNEIQIQQYRDARVLGKTNQDIINLFTKDEKILQWINDTRPILLYGKGTEPGDILVEFIFPDIEQKKLPGIKLPNNINTQTIVELEHNFSETMSDANIVSINHGIAGGYIYLEDSLPWFEVDFKGKGTLKKATDFCQRLSDAMNIRVLFNRMEANLNSYTIYGVMDIDHEFNEDVNNKGAIIPALSREAGWAEWMEDYGSPILPSHTKQKKTKKKMI